MRLRCGIRLVGLLVADVRVILSVHVFDSAESESDGTRSEHQRHSQ